MTLTGPDSLTYDSVRDPSYIHSKLNYSKKYTFLNYEKNLIEWYNKNDIEGVINAFSGTDTSKFSILHIGDSHIQADIFTNEVRNSLQQTFGKGGRGMVFPFKAAGTHSSFDYKTYKTGRWQHAKNVERDPELSLGVSGVSVRTTDPKAGFKFWFVPGSIFPEFTKIKVFCKRVPESFDLKVQYASEKEPLTIDVFDSLSVTEQDTSQLCFIEFDLPEIRDTLKFEVYSADTIQNFFECYGIQISTPEDKGILYNSVGINGAGLTSLLRENLLSEHIHNLAPKLVILDIGFNDFYPRRIDREKMIAEYNTVIKRVRKGAPEVVILLSSAQDVYYRYRNIGECKEFTALVRQIAQENNCAFYDYYNISGGRYSMKKWYAYGMAQRDRTHLSVKGYKLRGEIFFNALMNTYYNGLSCGLPDSLLTSDTTLSAYCPQRFIDFVPAKPVYSSGSSYYSGGVTKSKDGKKMYYKIRSGDNLGAIAIRFGVSVNDIMSWNGMASTKIIAGKTLVIYSSKSAGSSSTSTSAKRAPVNSKKSTSTLKGKVIHSVSSGESLWIIARKYGVSIDSIRKLNGLSSDRLNIGQKLIIKK